MPMPGKVISLVLASLFTWQVLQSKPAEKPNVILIVCDDLNDYVEGFGGHPNAITPNLARLA